MSAPAHRAVPTPEDVVKLPDVFLSLREPAAIEILVPS